jgi:hypothetical protein
VGQFKSKQAGKKKMKKKKRIPMGHIAAPRNFTIRRTKAFINLDSQAWDERLRRAPPRPAPLCALGHLLLSRGETKNKKPFFLRFNEQKQI